MSALIELKVDEVIAAAMDSIVAISSAIACLVAIFMARRSTSQKIIITSELRQESKLLLSVTNTGNLPVTLLSCRIRTGLWGSREVILEKWFQQERKVLQFGDVYTLFCTDFDTEIRQKLETRTGENVRWIDLFLFRFCIRTSTGDKFIHRPAWSIRKRILEETQPIE